MRRPAEPPNCAQAGCRWPAWWRPVLYAPVIEEDSTLYLVRSELPVIVCSRHKLPRHGWHGLTASRLVAALRKRLGERVDLERAWIAHELLSRGDA